MCVSYIAVLCFACATSNVVVPEGLKPMELIQRAQEASDRNRYGLALQYYEALLERNSHDSFYVCTAEYEIAFIHYKQKKYPLARTRLNALLERYAVPDASNLPPQFKLLAEKVLERIDERENKRRLFSR